jgi:hypothetical protein
MVCLRRLSVAVLLLIVAIWSAAVSAAEDKESRAAWKPIQAQLRGRLTTERVDAVRKLRTFPPLEAAKLVVQLGLGDRTPEVRRAAYETLLTWSEDAEVCRFLLTILDKYIRRKADASVLAPLIGVLLACDLPEIEGDVLKSLDALTAKPVGTVTVLAVADELGKQADRLALRLLKKMPRLQCFADSFACRRAIVRAMARVPGPQAVDALLELLPKLDGEVRGDLVRHLTQLTGQAHGSDNEAWLRWWKEHRGEFEQPAASGTIQLKEMVVQGSPNYYGLPLYAKRIVFVLDISGSMEGSRLEAAKRELIQAIASLPEDVSFSIIVYHDRVVSWQRYLVRATADAKKNATQFARRLMAGAHTATYDALESAMRFDVEAIYLLTDGEPTAGKIVATSEIVAAVVRSNAVRRISVYTIGIGVGEPGGVFDVFLKSLAENNFGQYRRVD